jgi:hypothetical protein
MGITAPRYSKSSLLATAAIPAPTQVFSARPTTVPPQTVTVIGLAEMLSIGQTTAWRLIRTREVKSLRIGQRVLIPVASIYDLIERKSAEPPPGKRPGGKPGYGPSRRPAAA